MPRLQYTPETIAFLQRHWNKDIPGQKLADDLGVSYEALKAAVSRLRKAGYVFETKSMPVGTETRYKTKDGGFVINVKTESGWKHVRSEGRKWKKPAVSKPRERDRKTNTMPKPRANRPKAKDPFHVDKNPKVVKVKPDEAGFRYVKTGRGTWVLKAPEKETA